MPKLSHEALVQLVRNDPALIPGLIWPEGQRPPAAQIHVAAAEFVDLNFAEHRADTVLAIGGEPGRPDEALVVEVQIEVDARKRMTWPLYVAGLRTRLACPVTLVVVALEPVVARWCAEPIDLGRGRSVVRPWVIGPESVPVVTDARQARAAPELAVLSVAAHADEPGAEHIALAALDAVHDLDRERGTLYPDFVLALLGKVARAALEQIMASTRYEYQSDIARKWFGEGMEQGMEKGKAEGQAEGLARGKAEVLLKLLQLKGFALTDAARERVLGCTDLAQLDAWVERVLAAGSLEDVLGR